MAWDEENLRPIIQRGRPPFKDGYGLPMLVAADPDCPSLGAEDTVRSRPDVLCGSGTLYLTQ